MRIIFAGTPEFAASALHALISAGHEIALVLTQPDRPAGRGLKLLPSAVKKVAQNHKLRVEQPVNLKTPETHALIGGAGVEAMVVAAYGLILPKALLALPKRGCINIHASLLPRWRGAAPIQRAILAGDAETGVTIMQMDEGLDTGGMLINGAFAIGAGETAGELHDRLAMLGAQLIVAALAAPHTPVAQDNMRATYAAKITKDEAVINWREGAALIARKVRAYNPFPGAATTLNGELLKIWRARALDGCGEPGAVDVGTLRVACGTGKLEIQELQRAGGKRLSAPAFLAGSKLPADTRLGQ